MNEALERLERKMDARFDQVAAKFDQIDRQFADVDRRFVEFRNSILEAVAAEGATTRRHFDIVAEQMRAERNLVIDKCLAVDERLLGPVRE